MIGLHTHTASSDEVLVPAGLVRRAAWAGYRTVAINNDAHAPEDCTSAETRKPIASGAGLPEKNPLRAEDNSRGIAQRLLQEFLLSA